LGTSEIEIDDTGRKQSNKALKRDVAKKAVAPLSFTVEPPVSRLLTDRVASDCDQAVISHTRTAVAAFFPEGCQGWRLPKPCK